MALKATAGSTVHRAGSSPDLPKTNVKAIVGGALAGVVAVSLSLLGAAMLRRHLQRSRSQSPPRPVRSPSPCTGTQEAGGNLTELDGAGPFVAELPSGRCAGGMGAGGG